MRKLNKRKVIIFALSIVGSLLLAGAGFTYYTYRHMEKTADTMHEELERTQPEKRENKVNVATKKDPISILLLGVDERAGDRGRSDTMIVATLNPEKHSMYMFNIPRDMRTEIIGKGKEDKINHAYAFGGVPMSVETVENLLDIPIDYYVKVNMEAFSDIVDALGGVTVNNDLEWTDTGYYKQGFRYKKGEITLENGAQALGYVRMRYEDPRGDFGRNLRQRQVIQAIIKKGASPAMITKFDDMLNILGDNIKTNMTFDEMKDIQQNYAVARENVEEFEITGKGTKINGVYYLIVPDEKRQDLTTKLKEHLEIGDTSTAASKK